MKKVVESNCCESCGTLKDENILLTTVKTFQGDCEMCEDCYNEFMQEKVDKQKLYAYICKKHKLEAPTPVIFGQVKKLVAQGYSYKQILYFVCYTHNIAKNFNEKYKHCINNVTWVLDEACEYFEMNNLNLEYINFDE